jgi:hypothetical protein
MRVADIRSVAKETMADTERGCDFTFRKVKRVNISQYRASVQQKGKRNIALRKGCQAYTPLTTSGLENNQINKDM